MFAKRAMGTGGGETIYYVLLANCAALQCQPRIAESSGEGISLSHSLDFHLPDGPKRLPNRS